MVRGYKSSVKRCVRQTAAVVEARAVEGIGAKAEVRSEGVCSGKVGLWSNLKASERALRQVSSGGLQDRVRNLLWEAEASLPLDLAVLTTIFSDYEGSAPQHYL